MRCGALENTCQREGVGCDIFSKFLILPAGMKTSVFAAGLDVDQANQMFAILFRVSAGK
jgi:hypothetical protein